MLCQGQPDRVPLFELILDEQRRVLRHLGLLRPRPSRDDVDWDLHQHLDHQLTLGYDYLLVDPTNFYFPHVERPRAWTPDGWRQYQMAGLRTISCRADLERYPWPDPQDADLARLDRAQQVMPAGMKVISGLTGIFETARNLLGFEGICYLLADDPDLVRDTFAAVGERVVAVVSQVAAHPAVGAVYLADDMGWRTQTLVAPGVLEELLFPWHRRVARAIHSRGKPAILHTCGNVNEVLDRIIDCGWDAKHSFEDAIAPAWDIKARMAGRMAVLGGFDVHKLARLSADEVRLHTLELLERCAPGGGFAVGSGVCVASYVPVENYLAMVAACHEFNAAS